MPIMTGAAEHWMTASVGIALGGSDPEVLLGNADAAAYRAKAAGRGRIEVFQLTGRAGCAAGCARLRDAVLSERTTPLSDAELLAGDARHVWHPYAPIRDPQTPLPVASAAGVRLRLRDGRELVDGMSSWWCAIHGYRHPVIDAALGEQLQDMAHVMLGGLTHEPVVALATRLAALAPAGLEQVFFADSGSVAVEVAIKLCLQYQRAVGRPERRRLITVRGGYHGDTLGAMSLCDPVDGMHSQFAGTVAAQIFADRPPAGVPRAARSGYAGHLRDGRRPPRRRGGGDRRRARRPGRRRDALLRPGDRVAAAHAV